MERKGYNGWTNYETWCVNLWLDNDEGLFNTTREMTREADNELEAAEAVKDMVEGMAPDLGGTLWGDMLNAALSEVNWQEIANVHREGMDDDTDDE